MTATRVRVARDNPGWRERALRELIVCLRGYPVPAAARVGSVAPQRDPAIDPLRLCCSPRCLCRILQLHRASPVTAHGAGIRRPWR